MKLVALLLMAMLPSYGQPGLEPPRYEVAWNKAHKGGNPRPAFEWIPAGGLQPPESR